MKGVSNVIVVMLCLVLVTIIVANVVLWSYQMNEFDLERMHEDVKIAGVDRVNYSSWFVSQNEYGIDTGSRVYGTYWDTQAIDGLNEGFIEGINWWNANYTYRRTITIENRATSTLDGNSSVSIAIDTGLLISSNKLLASGSDLRVAYWSGSSWIELDRDIKDLNTDSTQIWFRLQSAVPSGEVDSKYCVYYGNPNAGSPPADRSNVYLWYDGFNRADISDITTEASYGIKTGGGTWSIENGSLKNVGASGDPNKLLITALGNVTASIDILTKMKAVSLVGGDLSRMGLSCCMDAKPSRGSGYCALFHNDDNSLDLLNDLRSWGTHVTYSWSLNTWYYMRFRVTDQTSRLGEAKVWPVETPEPSAWTVNGDFGGGSARSFGEVGLAGSRASDTTYFDDIVIRYVTDPEPLVSLGMEESQINKRLEIDSTFVVDLSVYPLDNIHAIEMLARYRSSDSGERWFVKAYNWASSAYSDSDFNSTAGDLPTTGWDNYAVSITQQWKNYVNHNGTVCMKLLDEGADENQTTIDIDFLAVRVMIDGVRLTFDNKGASTCHIVALWVNDATQHQRYEISIFINSGDTFSYFRVDISLPEKPYVIKIITEKGNTAIYSDN